MKDWMKQWRRLLVRVGLLPPAELHYIGGSDTLPPPLSREREAELLERINALGIGPQGFGGRTTALAVNIETCPTHIAGLPVAVNINCHVTRHQTEVL